MELELLTRDATLDDWSTEKYIEVYQEVRGWDEGERKFALPLRKWVQLAGGTLTIADWNRFDHSVESGDIKLTRPIRNTLRRVVGAPPLPTTVAETIATNVSPDAAVYRLGSGVGDNVVIVGDVGTGVSLFVNGDVRVQESSDDSSVDVQGRTSPRRKYFNPRLPVEYGPRVKASGKSAAELIDFALKMQEQGSWW
jgi:hypothetical protein